MKAYIATVGDYHFLVAAERWKDAKRLALGDDDLWCYVDSVEGVPYFMAVAVHRSPNIDTAVAAMPAHVLSPYDRADARVIRERRWSFEDMSECAAECGRYNVGDFWVHCPDCGCCEVCDPCGKAHERRDQ